MNRTISVMVGKGSVNHNSRKFHAANTDPGRSSLNRSYCNDDIRQVYRDMFGDALARYNEKQARSDRIISDYYEKICTGKQEKPFHEIILQIGNCDDMNSKTANGELAARVLDEYMQSFQSRNPNMRVFSAHLHMDEATPHLHIDFVPFTTGSKRGLDTRVSLKQALAVQGFKGGTRQETEWNQWVSSEKNELASVMERHNISWLQKGTHEKHLSVLDYEKKLRTEEVASLEEHIDDLLDGVDEMQKSADAAHARLVELQENENLIGLSKDKLNNDPEWQLPEPTRLMSAHSYKIKIVEPLIKKLKEAVQGLISRYFDLRTTVDSLRSRLSRANTDIDKLKSEALTERQENSKLAEIAKDYELVRNVLGSERADQIVAVARAEEQTLRHARRTNSRDRGR